MFLDKQEQNLIKTIKSSSYAELDLLAVELREFLIDNVSKTGGHLASNLGAVELTIALHKVFDSPKDKIIFDVGHQSYVHKIITGRKDTFNTLRQLDGISGFPKRSESEHDMFDSGHSSTSISVAYGYAKARDIRKEKYNCIAVIGDGALTGGVAYEALNAAGDSKTPLIVILNDNQMSITNSKGGMAHHLHNLRTSIKYQKFKSNIKSHVEDMPKLYKGLQQTRDIIKNALIPTGIFEELGFKYFGPIDGHNIKAMSDTLSIAKDLNRPVLIHVITTKGKGFVPAEKNPTKFHGIGSFNPNEISAQDNSDKNTFSSTFGNKLLDLAKKDEKICAISAAMINATGLLAMQNEFPERVFDAGIAEQHAVSFAAGLALNGMKPVVAIYSTFLQRAYDQIVTEVALQNLPVVFAIDRAGITGRDGETHQGMFDISYLNCIPNMTILAPKDCKELEEMLERAFKIDGPVAIRYPRENNVDLSKYEVKQTSDYAEQIGDNTNTTNALIAYGSMVKIALEVQQILKNRNISISVFNLKQIKPLQKEFLDSLKYNFTKIVSIEDGCLNGGVGQTITHYLNTSNIKPMIKCITWPDKFIEHGSIEELRERYGLDANSIAKICEEYFEK